MIRGTRAPEEIWPEAPAEVVALWRRESAMLERLLLQTRGQQRRQSAVEILCDCPKRHTVVSIILLPHGEIAFWAHGGLRLHEDQLVIPGGDLTAHADALPRRYNVPHALDILPLEELRTNVHFSVGLVGVACTGPHRLSQDEWKQTARAIEQWSEGSRTSPVVAHLNLTE